MQAALILAGGKATRLAGIDKALLHLAGKPLIAHILARLTPQLPPGEKIAISANGDPTRFAAYDLPILPDHPAHTGIGPLAGILAGLIWAQSIGATSLLTIPVDTPFIPHDFLRRLTPAPAVATHRTRQHHLCAHWPTLALPALNAFLTSSPTHRIRDALTLLNARPIPFDTAPDPFHNINTPEDWEEAKRRLQARGNKNPSSAQTNPRMG